ncbi:MAG: hypothetical protein JW744_02960 [Candidatus Diapherotrites archaeon]|uniref:Fibronectin type-III domain-containing protein n=1 Tax=Candidatus Iainarchaeum sp. TaxID=3101447 RepID=A0A938YNG5_9ARCH|nr:hypothetical protein [Candidatus Diapherotrites archaeon]
MFCGKKAFFALALLLLLPACLALDAPDVSSSTHAEGEWSNAAEIRFEWPAVSGASKYCYVLSMDESAEPATCAQETSALFSKRKDDGEYFFRVRGESGSQKSSVSVFAILVDTESPSKPTLSSESFSDGSIELTWAGVEDTGSGVDYYEVYRNRWMNFSLRDNGVEKIGETENTPYIDVEGLLQNTTYHYKVRAIDKAGNAGAVSNEVHAKTAAMCDLDISIETALDRQTRMLSISISAADRIVHGSFSAEMPGGSTETFFEEKEPFSEWSGELDLSDVDEGIIKFHLLAEEFFGDNCDQDRDFIYDTTLPEIRFASPKYNERVSETVSIAVTASDAGSYKSGIKSVDFFIEGDSGWVSIGSGEETENSLFETQWDSFGSENGQTRVKAEAVDFGGNKADATLAIFILNAFSEALDANTAVERAEETRVELQEILSGFRAKGIESQTFSELLGQADSSLESAREMLSEPGANPTLIKNSAAEAMAFYTEAKGVVTVSDFKSSDFIFNKEQMGLLLNAAGISGQTAEVAKQFIEKADPRRQLLIYKVDDDNSVYYKAVVVVSFSLDVNLLADRNSGDLVVQVIELVPKEFAEYAAGLGSNVEFNVLSDDPVLQFLLTKDQYRKRELLYALKADLTEQQANALIENNTVNKYVAPPILLPPDAITSIMPPISLGLILFVGVAAIVIVVFILVLLVLKRRKKPRKGLEPAEKQPKGPVAALPKLKRKPKSPLEVFGSK